MITEKAILTNDWFQKKIPRKPIWVMGKQPLHCVVSSDAAVVLLLT